MAFKAEAFAAQVFEHRTEAVPVPGLATWFDGEAVWTVRGLTAHELARATEAADKRSNAAAVLEALVGGSKAEKVRELREAMALTDATPAEVSKRLEMLTTASVDPAIDHSTAVQIAERFPVEFYQLTNKITQLTGQGQVPGKPAASGDSQT